MEQSQFNAAIVYCAITPSVDLGIHHPGELNHTQKRKMRRGNLVYIISQLITIMGMLAMEGFLLHGGNLLFNIFRVNPYTSHQALPEPPIVTPGIFLLIGVLTTWHIMTNALYQPGKYHGKNSHWLQTLYKIATFTVVAIWCSVIIFFWFLPPISFLTAD